MRVWQKCPICDGVGQVSGGYYTRTGDCNHWVSVDISEICQTCKGKGIIEAPPQDALELLVSERMLGSV